MPLDHCQEAVAKQIVSGRDNLAVNSVAGSGKTYTIEESSRRVPNCYSILFSAFGNDIKNELIKRKLPGRVMNYNGLGWGLCLNHMPVKPELDEEKTKNTLRYVILGDNGSDETVAKKFYRMGSPIERIVSLLKGRLVYDPKEAVALIPQLMDYYAIEPPEDQDFLDLAVATFDRCINTTEIFDFDDQIYMARKFKLPTPSYDIVFVDEWQDTNDMQGELMEECARDGRMCVIGDPDQAIYGFRGATPAVFPKFIERKNAKEMFLSVCYRCSKQVIAEAKRLVPRIEAAPNAIEGSFGFCTTPEFLKNVRVGDMVLCRTVAPLVKRCLGFISRGVPAYVYGRDLGKDLEQLIDKTTYYKDVEINYFARALENHFLKKIEFYRKTCQERLIQALTDRVAAVKALMEDCSRSDEVKMKIDLVFSDTARTNAIRFMSGHKSKGLQAKRVFTLRPDLLPHPAAKKEWMQEEEKRLEYVIITRAQEDQTYVEPEKDERD